MHDPLSRRRPTLRAFMASEAGGGIVLVTGAILATLIANSPFAAGYHAALAIRIGPLPVLHWIDDALMAVFFLLVGLEVKRELLQGHLASWRARTLPFAAALSGMAVPALVYLAVTAGSPGLARGWAIPMATDIAFALAVMRLAGRCAPPSLKLFLTTVAVVDDMGAVAVIAFFYTSDLDAVALLAAAGVLAAMVLLNRRGVTRVWPYLLAAPLLWWAVWWSGIHATVAGVLAAAVIPLGGDDDAPLHRLERAIQPWVALAILPLFAFANAGVSLASPGGGALEPLSLGVAAGLVIGKPAGILAAIWAAERLGIARRPGGARWGQVAGMAALCGIGFTMSLFIGGLAFGEAATLDRVRVGVVAGSILSAVIGFAMLRRASA